MATLFSYVVDHDLGFAPNPYSGYCTLVHCKFSGGSGRRNIVESAKVGDWVLGAGGQNKQSAGNGKLIYLMRVDETPPFNAFLADARFQGREDCRDFEHGNEFALISRHFFILVGMPWTFLYFRLILQTDFSRKGQVSGVITRPIGLNGWRNGLIETIK